MDSSDIAAIVRPLPEAPPFDPALTAPETFQVAATRFEVLHVIKGPQSAQLTIYAFRPYRGSDPATAPMVFTEYNPESTYLVLVNHRLNGRDLFLTDDSQAAGSVLELRSVPPATAGASPLESVLDLLVANASTPPPEGCAVLSWIGSYGPLLWSSIPLWDEDTRDLLGRVPDMPKLVENLTASAIPVVEAETRTQDPEVSMFALKAAAQLQHADAVVPLAAFAARHPASAQEVESALSSFHTEAAVPALERLLQSPQPALWRAALASLGAIADRSSAWSILPLIKSGDPQQRYLAVAALYEVTGAATYPTSAQFAAGEQPYVRYWNDWAAAHRPGTSPRS